MKNILISIVLIISLFSCKEKESNNSIFPDNSKEIAKMQAEILAINKGIVTATSEFDTKKEELNTKENEIKKAKVNLDNELKNQNFDTKKYVSKAEYNKSLAKSVQLNKDLKAILASKDPEIVKLQKTLNDINTELDKIYDDLAHIIKTKKDHDAKILAVKNELGKLKSVLSDRYDQLNKVNAAILQTSNDLYSRNKKAKSAELPTLNKLNSEKINIQFDINLYTKESSKIAAEQPLLRDKSTKIRADLDAVEKKLDRNLLVNWVSIVDNHKNPIKFLLMDLKSEGLITDAEFNEYSTKVKIAK
ncbi:coiled-coil domain-containing protein [Flammeovirga kamogawensis]|uniref:Lipoprotein n=1 Tax=Flammeovirga kamogawensis TaxID=373891 RepID=A0ABX8GXF6_9BACT|nr:hypothetical protein [Flammeovirga kamogawensis]MBB6460947.1 chromosome segregation ATPase [Flammeovirga kamogawensis]QWG08289.1 hypothetical protein KM029_04960 [Flammeovirga kamogawensis]TRX66588.1 hypothetical protein EO216_00030 [Flammeovirga kamogawensis]